LMIFTRCTKWERFKVFFGHQKHQSPSLGSSLPWVLKCLLTGCFALTEFLKKIFKLPIIFFEKPSFRV
jgi:hypothetical protein